MPTLLPIISRQALTLKILISYSIPLLDDDRKSGNGTTEGQHQVSHSVRKIADDAFHVAQSRPRRRRSQEDQESDIAALCLLKFSLARWVLILIAGMHAIQVSYE